VVVVWVVVVVFVVLVVDVVTARYGQPPSGHELQPCEDPSHTPGVWPLIVQGVPAASTAH
jgi:hypothetical protein